MTTIRRFRGDTNPITIDVEEGGVAKDVTGHSFLMTVDDVREPSVSGATPVATIVGVIEDAANGVVSFSPLAEHVEAAGSYWYDIEMEDTNGKIKTLESGRFILDYDLSVRPNTITFSGTDDAAVPVDGSRIFTRGAESGGSDLIYQTRDTRTVIRYDETGGYVDAVMQGALMPYLVFGAPTSKFAVTVLAYMSAPKETGFYLYTTGWEGTARLWFDATFTRLAAFSLAPSYQSDSDDGAAITAGWWYGKLYVEPVTDGTPVIQAKWWELGDPEPSSPMLELSAMTNIPFQGPYGLVLRFGIDTGGEHDVAEVSWALT
jgi:hypothetical protein